MSFLPRFWLRPVGLGLLLQLGALLLLLSASVTRAGSIITLAKGAEFTGKLTLSPTDVEIEGAGDQKIALPDILEAGFGDAFQMNYFSSIGDTSTQLPPGWQGEDFGKMDVPGSATYASGELTLHSPQWAHPDGRDSRDPCFVFGLPWKGDGQWTFRIKSADAYGGFVIMDHVQPVSAHVGIASWDNNWDNTFVRDARGSTRDDKFPAVTEGTIPIWYRITRQGDSYGFETSQDGKVWNFGVQEDLDLPKEIWPLFFVNSHADKADKTVVFDQIVFTPASGQTSAPGVLLRSGSFLAGYFDPLDFAIDPPVGKFVGHGQSFSIAAAQTAAVVFQPMTRQQLAEVGTQVGILMKNGDIMTGDFQAIYGDGARLQSLVLGTDTYSPEQMRACVLHPLKPLPADYEIRLTDGSDILAKSISAKDGKFIIDEISGLEIPVAAEEIAQVRAGSSRVESLINLNWKATPPPAAKDAAASSPTQAPEAALCWTGNNQEKLLAVQPGTAVEFPWSAGLRTLAMRIALPPGSSPTAQISLRILADGKEIGHTPPMKAGEPPSFIQITLPPAKTVTLVAESASPGSRLLLIDPVAIRGNSP